MSFTEFIGIMAEAEFYHLFRMAIDKKDSGYLKARDLDRVLCSMRDQNAPGNRPCRDKVSSGLFVLALWKKRLRELHRSLLRKFDREHGPVRHPNRTHNVLQMLHSNGLI
jgi:hypothetical protein